LAKEILKCIVAVMQSKKDIHQIDALCKKLTLLILRDIFETNKKKKHLKSP